MGTWTSNLRPALTATALLSIMTGFVYPLAVRGAAATLFPDQADGSLARLGGSTVGSHLLAQPFPGAQWFQPRPSAAGTGWDGTASSGSNIGPLDARWLDSILPGRIDEYRGRNGIPPNHPVPASAVCASGSGLDPDITLEDALLQVPRVARERGIDPALLERRVRSAAREHWWGAEWSRPVNVLDLNISLRKGASPPAGATPES